jgi:hemerythrin-like domain-containing protein
MPLSAPFSLEKEHEEIWQLLASVQQLSGKTGSIAERLATSLKTHIDKEESLALPLLGILRELVDEKLSSGSATRAATIYSKFEKEYPGMLRGHKELAKHLERLKKVAADEGHLTALRFAEKLEKHSREEEEILYPAALLAGRFASKKSKRKS